MDFQHTEIRQMLSDSLQRLIRDRYSLSIRKRSAEVPGHDRATWLKLVELGAIGALFRPEDGGYGGEGFDIMVVFEALGAGLVAEPVLSTLMSGHALALAGHPLREAVAGGEAIVAFAHDEPMSRWDLTGVETRADATASGWLLTGTKAVVLNAEAASQALVSARTSGQPGEPVGISLFLVPIDTPGVTLRGYPLVDGGRAAELILEGAAVPKSALVGAPGEALAVVEQAVNFGILALCAEALGAMERLKTATLDYLRTRVQFGTPIGTNQALQHRMADLLIDIEQARSSVINAASAMARDKPERDRTLAAAKYTIGTTGTKVAEEAIQIHGGMGMTEELAATQFAKRLLMIDHQLGDADHHLQRFIELGRTHVATAHIKPDRSEPHVQF